ncbi:hypothetical protein HPB50_027229 [Hyalomma asiaticum]|uniref:Uncharacterized protein n=1 Tax=Hyalomma asiaticum TaxID=266040 RepID=A0ACB7TRZ1_HYAAI|nr:hypothetical protein HPB50_027229 [Hyalomma asiaticum]
MAAGASHGDIVRWAGDLRCVSRSPPRRIVLAPGCVPVGQQQRALFAPISGRCYGICGTVGNGRGEIVFATPSSFPAERLGGVGYKRRDQCAFNRPHALHGGFYCICLSGPCDDFRFRLAPEPFPRQPPPRAPLLRPLIVRLRKLRSDSDQGAGAIKSQCTVIAAC